MTAIATKGDGNILLLHGGSEGYVERFKEVFAGLGLPARVVLDDASNARTQRERVDEAIKSCRLPVVLATYNDANPGATTARPNVYDEIARCQTLGRDDVIVVLEVRDGKPVDLGSNHQNIVALQFDFTDPLRGMTSIARFLHELRERRLFSPQDAGSDAHASGSVFNAFLGEMDDIWDNHLDAAWDYIHQQDYDSEQKITLENDKFHLKFHDVVVALVRHQQSPAELRILCDKATAESKEIAVRCWEIAFEALVALAQRRVQASRRSAAGSEGHARVSRYVERFGRLRKDRKSAISTKLAEMKTLAGEVARVITELPRTR